ncbi:MAG: hypothetical protein RLZZ367_119 [Bacteroidota bacterium]
MFIKKAFFFLLLLTTLSTKAQVFDFDANSRAAYNAAIALKLDESSAMLTAAEKKNPDNLITIYLQNYIDFLRIYTSDTRALYDKLKTNKEIRLSQLMAGDPGSPYYLFTQAEVNLQWAALSIKFGEYVNAIFEIRKAYKALEQNQNRFPDFKANKKSLGVLYALLGSVPDKYKWGLNLLGMEGSVQKGINYLKEVTEYGRSNDFIYQEETITFYAFLLLHLQNDAETAWTVLQQNGFPKKDNLMNVYTCAHIGIYGKHTGPALQLLLNRPTSSAFTSFPFLNYLTGLAKINQLEPDADSYFKQYIAEYKGDNHIKSAYQKIAWGYLLKGDTTNYRHFMGKVLRYGGNTLDTDKQAQKEAESNRMPVASLLRARLLFDGGYYERAAGEMNRLTENSFANTEEQTEYYYRTARIYDEWNKKDSALVLYSKAIDKGKTLPRYFAANSAFETGKIYEARGDTLKAEQFYNLCLSFENHEYKNGLDQKAKAGLNRIR